MLEVAHEARLVDRVERPEAHRAGRELPELRHQVRMAIRATGPCRRVSLPVVVELLLGQPAFEESARIHAGRRVRLEVHQVAVRPRGRNG